MKVGRKREEEGRMEEENEASRKGERGEWQIDGCREGKEIRSDWMKKKVT